MCYFVVFFVFFLCEKIIFFRGYKGFRRGVRMRDIGRGGKGV